MAIRIADAVVTFSGDLGSLEKAIKSAEDATKKSAQQIDAMMLKAAKSFESSAQSVEKFKQRLDSNSGALLKAGAMLDAAKSHAAKFGDGMGGAGKTVAQLEKELVRAQASIDRSSESLDKAKQRASQYDAATARMQGSIDKTNGSIGNLQRELDSVNVALAKSEAATGKDSAETQKLQKESDTLASKIAKLKDGLVAKEKALADTTEKARKHTAAVNEQQAVLEANRKKLDSVSRSLESARAGSLLCGKSVAELQREFDAAKAAVDRSEKSLHVAQNKMREAQNSARQLNAEMERQASGVQGWAGRIAAAQDHIRQKWGTILNGARTAGYGLTAIGGGIVGSLGAAISESIRFESAFTGVTKTVDGTTEQMAEMRREILALSKQVPVTAIELSGIAESAGQLGIKRENILSFTKTIADLGVATNLAGEEGATMLAQFANIKKMDQASFSNLGSALVALGNNGASTEKDIMSMGLRIAAAGEVAGLSEGDILGLANAAASLGVEADAGGTAFSKTIIQVANAAKSGGESLEQFAYVAGRSATDFANEFNTRPAEAIASFVRGLGRMKNEGMNLFEVLEKMGVSEVRQRDLLLRLATSGNLMADSINLGNRAFEENSALVNEANKRYETTGSQLQKAKNSIADMSIMIGDSFSPAIVRIVKQIEPFVQNLSELISKNPEVTATVLKAAAALGVFSLFAGPLLIALPGLAVAVSGLRAAMNFSAASASIRTVASAFSAMQAATLGASAATTGLTGILAGAGGLAVIGAAGYAVYRLADAWIAARNAEANAQAISEQGAVRREMLMLQMRAEGYLIDEVAFRRMNAAKQNEYLQKVAVEQDAAVLEKKKQSAQQEADLDALKIARRLEYIRLVEETSTREQNAMREVLLTWGGSLKVNDEQRYRFLMGLANDMDKAHKQLERLSLDSHNSPSVNELAAASFASYLSRFESMANALWSMVERVVSRAWSALSALGAKLAGTKPGGIQRRAEGGPVYGFGAMAPAIINERGHEMITTPNGQNVMFGGNGARLVSLPVGSFVHTAEQTRALMRGSVPAYANGGFVGGSQLSPVTVTLNMGPVNMASNMDIDAVASRMEKSIRSALSARGMRLVRV